MLSIVKVVDKHTQFSPYLCDQYLQPVSASLCWRPGTPAPARCSNVTLPNRFPAARIDASGHRCRIQRSVPCAIVSHPAVGDSHTSPLSARLFMDALVPNSQYTTVNCMIHPSQGGNKQI